MEEFFIQNGEFILLILTMILTLANSIWILKQINRD